MQGLWIQGRDACPDAVDTTRWSTISTVATTSVRPTRPVPIHEVPIKRARGPAPADANLSINARLVRVAAVVIVGLCILSLLFFNAGEPVVEDANDPYLLQKDHEEVELAYDVLDPGGIHALGHPGLMDPLHHVDLAFGANQPDSDISTPFYSTDEILSPDIAAKLSGPVAGSRYFKAYGFSVCPTLDNSTFDAMTYIHPWGSTIAARNPTMAEFVELLDVLAVNLTQMLNLRYDRILQKHNFVRQDLRRLVCYAVSDGANSFTNFTDTRLVHRFDPVNYLKPIIPAVKATKSLIPGPKRKYQIAFLIMCHGDTFENVRELIEQLDDGSALILIHVDGKALVPPVNSYLHGNLTDYVRHREKQMNAKLRPGETPVPGNVFMAKTRFEGLWGHSSLVRMQLSGFWELADLGDWDYVINLSAEDFPLRRPREIYRVLQMEKHKGSNWLEHWDDNSESAARITRPHVPIYNDKDGTFNMFQPQEAGLIFPPFPHWKVCKCHQWMILTRELVTFLRESKEAVMALAYIELSWIPDESYFCYVTINSPYFAQKTINDKKRFLTFSSHASFHPMVLDIDSRGPIGTDEFGREPRYFFARKVDVKNPKGRELVEWITFEHIRKHLVPDGYGKLGGSAFVDLDRVMKEDGVLMDIDGMQDPEADLAASFRKNSGGVAPAPPPDAAAGEGGPRPPLDEANTKEVIFGFDKEQVADPPPAAPTDHADSLLKKVGGHAGGQDAGADEGRRPMGSKEKDGKPEDAPRNADGEEEKAGPRMPEIFETTKKYNIMVKMSRNDELNSYILEFLQGIKEDLLMGLVYRVYVAVLDKGLNPIEKFIFQVRDMMAQLTPDSKKTALTSIGLGDIEDFFRTIIRKVNFSDTYLRALPDDCSFRLYCEMTDEESGPTSKSEGIAWSNVDEGNFVVKNSALMAVETLEAGVSAFTFLIEK
ncbi:Xylosyltransferase 2 [Irineochytrium annulatum]|nr:Xylosyltransferase 2 [Irineochytrium annulatum]